MLQKRLLLTCEHSSYAIPKSLKPLFQGAQEIISSHRGFDLGALSYARELSKRFDCPLYAGRVSRLVIDVNRSLHHPSLFSEYTKELSKKEKNDLIQKYWMPLRQNMLIAVGEGKGVLHLSCHTFTPCLHGVNRSCDVGLLYDPARLEERLLAQEIYDQLTKETSLRIRKNYPYKGKADGHTTSLRHIFVSAEYVGLEVEVNQALVKTAYWKYVGLPALYRAITTTMHQYERNNLSAQFT
jgi:predicted N-formylglutamate amidohydrolase